MTWMETNFPITVKAWRRLQYNRALDRFVKAASNAVYRKELLEKSGKGEADK